MRWTSTGCLPSARRCREEVVVFPDESPRWRNRGREQSCHVEVSLCHRCCCCCCRRGRPRLLRKHLSLLILLLLRSGSLPRRVCPHHRRYVTRRWFYYCRVVRAARRRCCVVVVRRNMNKFMWFLPLLLLVRSRRRGCLLRPQTTDVNVRHKSSELGQGNDLTVRGLYHWKKKRVGISTNSSFVFCDFKRRQNKSNFIAALRFCFYNFNINQGCRVSALHFHVK